MNEKQTREQLHEADMRLRQFYGHVIPVFINQNNINAIPNIEKEASGISTPRGFVEGSPFPMRHIGDMAVVYAKELTNHSMPLVTWQDLADINRDNHSTVAPAIFEDQLYQAASKNIGRFFPSDVRPISEMLGIGPMVYPEEESPILVVRNEAPVPGVGAAAIMDRDVQNYLSNKFPGGYDILPSSKFEMLAIPSDLISPEEAKSLVMDINRSEVAPQERLSDNVFAVENGRMICLTYDFAKEHNAELTPPAVQSFEADLKAQHSAEKEHSSQEHSAKKRETLNIDLK